VRIENYVNTQKKNKREKNLPFLLPPKGGGVVARRENERTEKSQVVFT
jgi:hypothetical protein